MNKKKLSAIIMSFLIGSTIFMSNDYLFNKTNTVYAATVNQNLPALTCIDTPRKGDVTLNQTIIKGWSLNASKVNSVDILVYGNKVGNATLGISRPDVNKFYLQYKQTNSGFSYNLDTSKLTEGFHNEKQYFILPASCGKN